MAAPEYVQQVFICYLVGIELYLNRLAMVAYIAICRVLACTTGITNPSTNDTF